MTESSIHSFLSIPDTGNQLSSKDSAFFQLRDGILDGVYEPGSPLPEAKISKELGLSRTPVREAFSRLEFYGLAYSIAGKGTFVADFDARVVGECFDILNALELAALRKVFRAGLAPALSARLRESVEFQQHLAEQNQVTPARETARGFHEMLVQTSGNKRLLHLWSVLRLQIEYFSRLQMRSPVAQQIVISYVHDHDAMVVCMEQNDEDRAAAMLTQHFDRQRDNLLKLILG